MGAWKSSDGGTITPLGSSLVDADYVASTVLIPAGVNVKGITIRTAFIMGVGGSGWGYLKAGGIAVLHAAVSDGGTLPHELFIPAGRDVELWRGAGTLHVGISYDIH